ncbi:MAG: DNA alkylation repair protein [Ignavibacteriales bacterium]|nr:DNA alkylation repair protein [Ignavibacteriales bacterium]
MTASEIILELKKHYNKRNVKGMARYGINVEKAFGLNVPFMRAFAKKIGKDHKLALELWKTGYHEARHIASMIDDPKLVSKSQMNKWVRDFNSWDICDGTCSNLFRKTPFTVEKILEWCEKKEEYLRRAGFSLLCYVAVHDKKRDDKDFLQFFPLIKKYSIDERNFVKKAVNWALRQIGKRSKFLNKEALKLAKEIQTLESKSAKWIADDAIRELTNPKILARIKK